MMNTIPVPFKKGKFVIYQHFTFCEQLNFCSQLSSIKTRFITSEQGFVCSLTNDLSTYFTKMMHKGPTEFTHFRLFEL